ncbi:MAG TPA: DUF2577 family protein [Ruminiclostridium sp.]|nr:DUF2577 family protein [Ruminiclostridium sp.]
MDDPYKLIIQTMRKEGSVYNPPSVMLGEVTDPPPDLLVNAWGLQLDRDNLKVADYLAGTLTKGDEVVIMPTSDKSQFIILCRVVGL